MPRGINAANLLTLLRLVLVPFVIGAILEGHHTIALALFACAASTDVLDGAVARRFGLATPGGAWFDPIADKCLLSGVFLALAGTGIVPWWLVGIIFGRDLYILLGAAAVMLLTPVRRFPPSIWGKVSTFVQIVTAVLWMAGSLLQARVMHALSSAMLWPCAAFTVWSGIDYTRRAIRTLREH
ncbi:MAG: CDP-alcohol phosphatidyltransferase family protein [Bryobacteraceae bacterium]|jgi:cardiolipin synthase